MELWSRLTPNCRRIILKAHDESRRLGRQEIGSLELLLAALQHRRCRGYKCLAKQLPAPQALQDEIRQRIPPGEQADREQVVFTEAAQIVLRRACEEAKQRSDGCVRSEYLFLALLNDAEVLQAIAHAELRPEELREALVEGVRKRFERVP